MDRPHRRGNHGNGAKAKDGAHGPHARRGAPGQGGARRQPFRRFVDDSHNRRGRVRAHADDADRRTVKPLFLLLCLVRRDIGVVVNRIGRSFTSGRRPMIPFVL